MGATTMTLFDQQEVPETPQPNANARFIVNKLLLWLILVPLLIVLALVLFGGLAYAKDKPPIQATIQAPIETVKGIAMSRALAAGFLLDSEAQFQLTFAKNMSEGQSLVVQALGSPAACAAIHPRHILTIALAPGDQTLIVAAYQYEHAGPFCRTVRESINDGKVRKQLEDLVGRIKADAEPRK